MSEKTFTLEEAEELFVTAWCAAQYRGQLGAKSNAREITKRTARNKFTRYVETNDGDAQ